MVVSRARLMPTLAVVMLAGLAASARADESQFLPSDAHVVFSLNFQDVLKSKTYAELKKLMKQVPEAKEDPEEQIVRELGVPANNIARITMGIAFRERDKDGGSTDSEVGMITTVKPVTAAALIAAKKPRSYQKNVTYKEIKVGKFVVHQQHFQFQFDEKDKPGDVVQGSVFCVVEPKLVLFTERTRGLDSLRKILEQSDKPELSKNMQTGLKYAAFTNTGIVVIDIQGMPAREKNDMFRFLNVGALKDMADNFEVVAMRANEKGKFMGQAALFCKDAGSAAKARTAIEASLAELKAQLKDDPKTPAPFQGIMKAAREGLDAIKVSVEANQTIATVNVDPAVVGKLFFGAFAVGPGASPPAVEVKEVKEEK